MKAAVVPRLYPQGGTMLIAASGPSLTEADINRARPHVDGVIVINTSYQLATWATALYAADAKWWAWHKGAPEFKGLKYSVSPEARRWPGVQILKQTGDAGLELEPNGLKTGRNSGYQAINLAVHFGAKRILLLGYDMQTGYNSVQHWHGEHPCRSRADYDIFKTKFKALPEPLAAAGVTVLNCTRNTALKVFPIVPLEEALCQIAA